MEMTPRKLNAVVLLGIGILLMLATEPLAKSMVGSPPLVLAGINFLSPVGVIFFVLGIYRFATNEKPKK